MAFSTQQRYQAHLEGKKKGGGAFLAGTIAFLQNTAKLITIFSGPKCLSPIRCMDDQRISEIKQVAAFFQTWEDDIKKTSKKYTTKLLSAQCREDLQSTCLGFLQVCKQQLRKGTSVIPGRMNSDVVENVYV